MAYFFLCLLFFSILCETDCIIQRQLCISSKSSGCPWQMKENNNKQPPVRSSHAPQTSVFWGVRLKSASRVNRLAQWLQHIVSFIKVTPSQVCGLMRCFHWLEPFMPDWLLTCPDSLWMWLYRSASHSCKKFQCLTPRLKSS